MLIGLHCMLRCEFVYFEPLSTFINIIAMILTFFDSDRNIKHQLKAKVGLQFYFSFILSYH